MSSAELKKATLPHLKIKILGDERSRIGDRISSDPGSLEILDLKLDYFRSKDVNIELEVIHQSYNSV